MHYLSPPSSLNNEGKIQEIYSAGLNIWDGGFSNAVKRKKLLFTRQACPHLNSSRAFGLEVRNTGPFIGTHRFDLTNGCFPFEISAEFLHNV
jgi:hypothetical protein